MTDNQNNITNITTTHQSIWLSDDEIENLKQTIRTIEQLQQDITDITEWICETIDYPFGMFTTTPIPKNWQTRIENWWVEKNSETPQDETIIRAHVAEEGGWDQ